MKDFDKEIEQLATIVFDMDKEKDITDTPWEKSALLARVIKKLDTTFKGTTPIPFIEALLSHYKGLRHDIVSKEIPSLLMQAGLQEAKTSKGLKVSVKPVTNVKIFDDKKEDFINWFLKQEPENSVYVKRILEFNKGDNLTELDDFTDILKAIGVYFKDISKIHPQTLKKQMNLLVEKGRHLPSDIGTVKIIPIAKVKGE